MILSHKRMNVSQMHIAKEKKSVWKFYICISFLSICVHVCVCVCVCVCVYASHYMTLWKGQNYRDNKQISGLEGGDSVEAGEGWIFDIQGMGILRR